MKFDYWSCSKFADWLRGTPKIYSGTAEEWNTWKKVAKGKKVRYWLAEKGLDFLEDFFFFPVTFCKNIRHYIENRWISKTHALTSNLKRGQWYEFDTRVLHALFDELVNFVEIEQAWRHVVGAEEEESKKYRTPWYRKLFRLSFWRCPEAGLTHLEWAAGLKKDEDWVDKNDPSYGQPTPQALAAQEIMMLYKWWKEDLPKRQDPMDASGWSDYCEEKHQEAEARGDDMWIGCVRDEADRERSSKISEICHRMEQDQEEEDTAMLIRLIKIRRHLWT